MQNKGFTLIEIIVATSIFTVVMLVTMGALISLNDSSRKAQALRTVIDNLNFAVEDMNRKIRTGGDYHCYESISSVPQLGGADDLRAPRDCPKDGGPAISLMTQEVEGADKKNVWVAYFFQSETGRIIQRRSPTGGGASLDPLTDSAITSPEVKIRKMEFRVVGAEDKSAVTGEKTQPMVILNISGVVDLQKEKLKTEFSLQTVISRRGLPDVIRD